MKLKNIIILIFFLCSVNSPVSILGENPVSDEGRRNYLEIRNMYNKWENGPEGSRGHFRRRLYMLLVEMIGREITTDYDYIPEYADDFNHTASIESGKWLVITGDIDSRNMKEVDAFRREHGRNSQPGKGLFSLSGRIKKFRLSDFSGRRIVYLHLENMIIRNAEVKI